MVNGKKELAQGGAISRLSKQVQIKQYAASSQPTHGGES
jgi:hypothetical protein